MALKTKPFDVADYLADDAEMVEFLTLELQSGELFYMAEALGAVARAKGGMAQLAKETGISEDELQRATDGENADRQIILRAMAALGVVVHEALAA